MSACCPRCREALEEQQLDNFLVQFCRDCRGLLLHHPDLIAVIEGGNNRRRVSDIVRVVGLEADGRFTLHSLGEHEI